MGNVSLRPEDFGEGGGLLDDADVSITDARFILGDYGGTAAAKSPMCSIKMADAEGVEHEQFYSVGSADDFVPDDSGKGLDKVGKKSAIIKSSNFGSFMDSLVKAGFPSNKIEPDDITCIVGTDIHVKRVARDTKGLTNAKANMTVLLVDKVNKLPWEKSAAKGSTKATGASKAAAPAEDTSELDNFVHDVIVELLGENGGSMTKAKLLGEASKLPAVKEHADKKAIITKISNDAFLKGSEDWKFENGTLTF